MAATTQKTDEPDAKDDPIGDIQRETDKDLYEWIQQFGATGEIKVRLARLSPTKHRGVKVDGALETYQEPVTVDRIKEEHGGGKFQIRVEGYRRDPKTKKRRWGYIEGRTFDVAGAPKLDSLLNADDEEDEQQASSNGENQGLASQAMNVMTQQVRESREEARQLRDSRADSGGKDLEMLELILAPMREEMKALRERLADKDDRLVEALNKEPDNTGQERLFGIMESKEATHSNNLEAIRQQYEARMARREDFHLEELKRYEARFERELAEVRSACQREVHTLKSAHQQAMDSQRHGFEMRIDGLRDIQKRLEREVNKAETETVALRTRKEQGPIDQIQNLVTVKEAFEALVPSGGGDKAGWERALEMVTNSPIAGAIAGRVAGAAAGVGAEGEEDEQLVQVRLQDGRVVEMPKGVVDKMREQQAAKQAEREARRAAGEPEIPEVSDEDMAKAVAFMETAIRNNTPPAVFAATARNMLPDDILDGLRRLGVDVFLGKMAKIQTGSPLATVPGRVWVRQVAEFLLTGEISEEPEPAEEPDEEAPDDLTDDLPDDLGDPETPPDDSPVEET
ncbi:MAG: hypothetical protein ACYSWU_00165 [Planctomycetota bacterium]|jgi:hypothetical protein